MTPALRGRRCRTARVVPLGETLCQAHPAVPGAPGRPGRTRSGYCDRRGGYQRRPGGVGLRDRCSACPVAQTGADVTAQWPAWSLSSGVLDRAAAGGDARAGRAGVRADRGAGARARRRRRGAGRGAEPAAAGPGRGRAAGVGRVLVVAEPAVVFSGGPVEDDSVAAGRPGPARRGAPGAATGHRPGSRSSRSPSRRRGAPWSDGVRVFAGYAGWAPGQLEGEVDGGSGTSWTASPATSWHADPAGLWRTVLRRQRGATRRLALVATWTADPELN